ncbi:MAG: tyrosine-type recombinase/integrase [Pseudomonadota bacterium]|nr:tyrosine-type recombinase/integrase [Pseudomonadota bacterium]MDP1904171.1 tyrosine-type recombinase/integrase [Pseudomonadota bacterium]
MSDRQIGRHHIAFYRGWLLGLDVRPLADRYLETGLDLRLARSTLTWVRDSIRQAALRHGRHGEARLLRLHLAQTSQAAGGAATAYPSLEEFQDDFDPDGYLREEDLIRLYIETYPEAASKKAQHRQRLINRQIAALMWIENLLTTVPVRADPVYAWFDKNLADRLLLAGLVSIGSIMERISSNGYRWWTTVPRLGEKGAIRIAAWLQGYEESLGPIPVHALAPIRSQSPTMLTQTRLQETAVVPMDVLIVPKTLAGETGSNRHHGQPRINAANDHQAIQSWLDTKSGSPNTARAYRKEAERMLLWSILERGKALSDLDIDDCAAYRDWLSTLGRTAPEQWPFNLPQANWIGKRNTPRFSADWRPFDGALSAASIRQALTIMSGLFEWMTRVQYCSFNPWDAVSKGRIRQEEAPDDVELTRVFSEGQWRHVMDVLQGMPSSAQTERLRFVLPFAHATGLRLSELVEANTGRIYTMPLRASVGVRWMLKVLGKGSKWRAVPLSDRIISILGEYLVKRGVNSDPFSCPLETPLIAKVSNNDPVSTSSLYKAIRDFFQMVADSLRAEGRNQEAKTFDRASVHWLRHTCGSHLGTSGVPVNLIQKLMGHASLATTGIYTSPDDEVLWNQINELEAADNAY